MEKYYLNTLIFFLKTQMEMGFKGIEQLLAIIDNGAIPEARKRKAIFQVLHFYGLNEIGYKDGRFEFSEAIPIEETPTKNVEDLIRIPAQTLNIRLLNGTLELAVPLN